MDRFHPNVGIKEAELPDIPAVPTTLSFQDSLLEIQSTTAELLNSSSLAFLQHDESKNVVFFYHICVSAYWQKKIKEKA